MKNLGALPMILHLHSPYPAFQQLAPLSLSYTHWLIDADKVITVRYIEVDKVREKHKCPIKLFMVVCVILFLSLNSLFSEAFSHGDSERPIKLPHITMHSTW